MSENANFIQYDHRKCGTNARGFSRTLAQGKRNIEIRQRNRGRRHAENSKNGHEKCPCDLTIAGAYHPSGVTIPRSSE